MRFNSIYLIVCLDAMFSELQKQAIHLDGYIFSIATYLNQHLFTKSIDTRFLTHVL